MYLQTHIKTFFYWCSIIYTPNPLLIYWCMSGLLIFLFYRKFKIKEKSSHLCRTLILVGSVSLCVTKIFLWKLKFGIRAYLLLAYFITKDLWVSKGLLFVIRTHAPVPWALYIYGLISLVTLWCHHSCSHHSIHEETEAKRGEMTCWRSHS